MDIKILFIYIAVIKIQRVNIIVIHNYYEVNRKQFMPLYDQAGSFLLNNIFLTSIIIKIHINIDIIKLFINLVIDYIMLA